MVPNILKKTGRTIIQLWKILLKLIVFLFFFSLLQVISLKFINPVTTPNVVWEWCESILKKTPDKKPVYIFTKMEDISPHLRRAVLAGEDQRFLSHNGFDYKEIFEAARARSKGKKLRGASTISMQTARSVFWLSSRNMVRKAAEVYYTVLIEFFWDKERVLELYLNTVDWGTGVTGAEAAAQKYFNTRSKYLTPSQAALMVAVLPNPHRWSPNRPTAYILKRQATILSVMDKMPLL